MQYGLPINFNHWLDTNAERFKPPVGNQQIWANSDFICTVSQWEQVRAASDEA